MNLSDLTEVLRDRAELPDSSHEARMAGVRARVSAAKRRRAVLAVAGVVLALVGIVYAVLPRVEQPEPAVPPRSLPEYVDGTRIIAQAWGDLPSTSVTTQFVPKSLDFVVFTRCETAPDVSVTVSVFINGHLLTEDNGCGGWTKMQGWSGFEIEAGKPSVITLNARGTSPRGAFAVGIGEPVPVSEYPFPPRPQTLETFPPDFPQTVKLRSDQADPLRQKDFTIEWPGSTDMRARMNTPGRMRVLVNGVQVLDFSHWTYATDGMLIAPMDWKDYGVNAVKGQTVKITVIPERVTGEWEVALTPRPR
ncbi:hypothetical protein ACSHWB_34225 [Lentzea sp. HUAS TT2]|uniref:hypothetical protein n=1 Tax=Lentzea sp. HUAS TT2 TaxID=3447454 RepID=UPI003F72B4AA